MASSAVSRRMSEFLGVALFASALICLISLASYSPSDPVWFFNTGSSLPPDNFAGRVGAFLAELSYQLLGYSAFLLPLVLVVLGWHYFWCRTVDAGYTKLLGAAMLFGCLSSFLSLAFGTLEVAGKEFRAGGYVGDRLAAALAEYLNRTGSIILILTLLFAAIILSTQFSFGRLFSILLQVAQERWTAFRAAADRRRDEKVREKQRQEVLKKHLGKDTKGTKDTKEAKDTKEKGKDRLRNPRRCTRDGSCRSTRRPASSPRRCSARSCTRRCRPCRPGCPIRCRKRCGAASSSSIGATRSISCTFPRQTPPSTSSMRFDRRHIAA
jgi:DNA segregation ATPase FtsK/SpoIIIE-like protein